MSRYLDGQCLHFTPDKELCGGTQLLSEFYLEENHKLVCQSDNCIIANGDYS
jgi:hypothetical protein